MASKVDIWNMALGFLKERTRIQSEDDTSSKAGDCRLYYPLARDAVLEAHDWSFARSFKALALHADDPPTDGWEYMYSYPSDCLAVRYIDDTGRQLIRPPIAYRMINYQGQKMILTNQQDAVVCYTYKLEDPNLFTNLFTTAVAWYLATLLAPGITNGKMLKTAQDGYKNSIMSATAFNLNEEQEELDYTADTNSPTMAARN